MHRNSVDLLFLNYFSWWTGRDSKNYTYWHGNKDVNDTGCACAEDNSCITYSRYFDASYYNTCNRFLLSLDSSEIKCNCDDEKTGITDNNLLKSKDQLPVTGKV